LPTEKQAILGWRFVADTALRMAAFSMVTLTLATHEKLVNDF
jgi:hypothetical protein